MYTLIFRSQYILLLLLQWTNLRLQSPTVRLQRFWVVTKTSTAEMLEERGVNTTYQPLGSVVYTLGYRQT